MDFMGAWPIDDSRKHPRFHRRRWRDIIAWNLWIIAYGICIAWLSRGPIEEG